MTYPSPHYEKQSSHPLANGRAHSTDLDHENRLTRVEMASEDHDERLTLLEKAWLAMAGIVAVLVFKMAPEWISDAVEIVRDLFL